MLWICFDILQSYFFMFVYLNFIEYFLFLFFNVYELYKINFSIKS